MSTTSAGTAAVQGELWGARARDWSEQEAHEVAKYEQALDRLAIGDGARVLDVGCGAGVFLRLAADRGANVSGLDASAPLLECARKRVPGADLRLGEMEALPFDDDTFDFVTGFNSFFFAADIVNAVREAGRVAKPGGTVVLQVWGNPEHCELMAVLRSLAPLRPPRPAPAGPGLSEPGVLEGIAAAAGLRPETTFDAVTSFAYGDADQLARAIMSAGAVVEATRESGEQRVREAILQAAAPFRSDGGGYRFDNEWHYVFARA